jgi:hypothetical protein
MYMAGHSEVHRANISAEAHYGYVNIWCGKGKGIPAYATKAHRGAELHQAPVLCPSQVPEKVGVNQKA